MELANVSTQLLPESASPGKALATVASAIGDAF
jgi:hypothetical protein